jgi:hypothetical protein
MYQKIKLVGGAGDMESESTLSFSLLAANTNNATLVKAGPSVLYSIHAVNVNASPRYLKFYDMKAAPQGGAGTPTRRYAIPGNASGAGFVLQPVIPMKFVNGIAFALVTGVADSDNTSPSANDVILTLEYI